MHVRPHAPQCAADDDGSTQELLQQSIGAAHGAPLPHWQWPATQVSPAEHAGVHVGGGWHVPPTQVSPLAHMRPHTPQ